MRKQLPDEKRPADLGGQQAEIDIPILTKGQSDNNPSTEDRQAAIDIKQPSALSNKAFQQALDEFSVLVRLLSKYSKDGMFVRLRPGIKARVSGRVTRIHIADIADSYLDGFYEYRQARWRRSKSNAQLIINGRLNGKANGSNSRALAKIKEQLPQDIATVVAILSKYSHPGDFQPVIRHPVWGPIGLSVIIEAMEYAVNHPDERAWGWLDEEGSKP